MRPRSVVITFFTLIRRTSFLFVKSYILKKILSVSDSHFKTSPSKVFTDLTSTQEYCINLVSVCRRVNILFHELWYIRIFFVNNFSFFRDDVAIHEKKELTRLSEVFRFSFLLTFVFSSSDASFFIYVCFVRKMSLYDFQHSATPSRLLLWRCRGHPPT